MQRRSFCAWGGAALTLPWHSHASEAYPSRTVRLICPFAPGGGPDVQLRQLAPSLGEALGQSVIVENKVGAGGVLAAQYTITQPPDGYTLLQGSSTHLVQKLMTPSLKFDPLTDFAFATNMSTSPTVLVVTADSPFKRAEDIIAAAKAAPGKLNYSSGGIGSAAHLAGATFMALPGVSAVHVPLKGSVEIMPSLLRGDTQFAFPTAGTGVPQVRNGKLRALAVTSPKRLAQLPDVPTLEEVLKSKLAVQESWSGLWAPAKTPTAVLDRLNRNVNQVLALPAIRKQIDESGSLPVQSASPQAFADFVRSENAKWAEVIRLTGVTAT